MNESTTPPHPHNTVTELEKKLRNSRLLSLTLAVILLIVGGAYALLLSDTNAQQGLDAPAADSTDSAPADTPETEEEEPGLTVEDLASEPYMVLGEEEAPVTVYEWTDFTCPYCGVFHRDTLPQVVEEYVEKSLIKVVVHDVTFVGGIKAEDAAIAARAAGRQGQYFDYLFAVYELGAEEDHPALDASQLWKIADERGLNMRDFDADISSHELREAVQTSTLTAQQLGITGVPYFVVTPTGSLEQATELRGAQPTEVFTQTLDTALERAGK